MIPLGEAQNDNPGKKYLKLYLNTSDEDHFMLMGQSVLMLFCLVCFTYSSVADL